MEELFLNLECGKGTAEGRIAVVGDAILDEYVTGAVKEAAYPVFLPEKRFMYLGGAGNVALNIKEMWNPPDLYTVVGEDENSGRFRSILQAKGLESKFFNVERPRSICHKIRYMSQQKVLFRIDNDDTREIISSTETQLYNKLKYNIEGIKVLVISNYHKGCLSEGLLKKIKTLCALKKIKVLFDAKKMCDFNGVYLLKMKAEDFTAITEPNSDMQLSDAMLSFKNTHEIQNLLITMGQKGAAFLNAENQYTDLPAVSEGIINSCGAGDSMLSALAVCAANGISMESALVFSNYAAAVACQQDKTYAVSLSDIQECWERSKL